MENENNAKKFDRTIFERNSLVDEMKKNSNNSCSKSSVGKHGPTELFFISSRCL